MKHQLVVFAVFVVVCALALPASASAQALEATQPKKPAPIVIDLDGDVIEASPQRPSLPLVISDVGGKKHTSLIRLRTDFRAQVLSSVSRL